MNETHSKSSIMLLEIMINICFFAVLISICLVLLFRALRISNHSEDLNHSVTLVNTAASLYEECNGDTKAMEHFYSHAVTEKGGLCIYYDGDYQESTKKDASFVLQIQTRVDESDDPTASLKFLEAETDRTIYEEEIFLHLPLTREPSAERQVDI